MEYQHNEIEVGFAPGTAASHFIVIAMKKEDIQRAVSNFNWLSDEQREIYELSANKLSASKDNSASTELSLVHQGTKKLVKIVLAVLPTACSRHNTPSRSHAVSAIVKAHKCDVTENLEVHIVNYDTPSVDASVTVRDIVYAQAVAVGRAFPTFSLKSSNVPLLNRGKVSIVLTVLSTNDTDLLHEIKYTISSVRYIQGLVDSPPNVLNCKTYVEHCQSLYDLYLKDRGCTLTIIQGEELQKQGFGGIWGVGKASDNLPAFVVLSYVPKGKESEKSVCMVGKGIVYDTGGLSIKVPPNMAGMKNDMGGSAAVLGAFITAVMCGVAGPLHGILCIAENSVGPLATRPDDVHILLSGKSVEINNTDAEGRLVLSDGVYYASTRLNPSHIFDIATLTGAQLIATGRNHAAIYCNDDELEDLTIKVGKSTGDLVHPIPFAPEFYRKEFKSEVADMKNSVADRSNAQSSCAAQFVGNHIESYLDQGGKWCHIDMAGPVDTGSRATGYGVALLYKLASALGK